MDSDNPTLRWSLAAVGVVVVCFCLGYFVFGTKGSTEPTVALASPSPTPGPPTLPVTMVNNRPLEVEDITDEKDAERKRKEAEEKAKAEAKLKAEQAKLAEPTPDPDAVTEPTDDKAVPTDEKTTPDEEKPKATEEKPKATEEKPKATEEKPKATEEKPKAIEEKPKATEEKPKATEEKPKATEEKPKAKTETEKEVASKSLYRVRIGGTKTTREDAEKLVAQLRGQGYTPAIIADQRKGKTVFHVQAGAFSDSESAERRKKELENNGYDVRIN